MLALARQVRRLTGRGHGDNLAANDRLFVCLPVFQLAAKDAHVTGRFNAQADDVPSDFQDGNGDVIANLQRLTWLAT
jgi:hypothetical protein